MSETISVPAIADTALFELDPDSNFGGQADLTAGALGPQGGGQRARALYKFDVAGALPTNAVIRSALCQLTVTKTPEGAVNSSFGLHRVLRDWGEGKKKGGAPGGAPAEENEATWKCRFYPDILWTVPGGQSGIDYVDGSTSTERITGDGVYEFEFGGNQLDDLRGWQHDPATNFGWILISQSENLARSARRFGARDHFLASRRPALVLEYTVIQPPRAPVITGISRTDSEVSVVFLAQAGVAYTLQATGTLTSPIWTTVSALAPATTDLEIVFTHVPGPAAEVFYRIEVASP